MPEGGYFVPGYLVPRIISSLGIISLVACYFFNALIVLVTRSLIFLGFPLESLTSSLINSHKDTNKKSLHFTQI